MILDENGSKVDFECYARHGSTMWPNLLAGKDTESDVVRVAVKPVAYYNYAFSDDATWRAFVANSPDLKNSLYIYARRGSKEAKQLANFKTKKPARVTLAIRSLEGSHLALPLHHRELHAPTPSERLLRKTTQRTRHHPNTDDDRPHDI